MKFSASIFSSFAYSFGVISKKLLSNLRSEKRAPKFSSQSFMILVLTFISFIHFE